MTTPAVDAIGETSGGNITATFLFRHALEGMAWVDMTGVIRAANPSFCQIVEYAESEIVGKPFSEITVSEDAVHDIQQFARMKAGEIEDYAMTKRYRTKSQRTVTVTLRARKFNEGALVIGQVLPIDRLSLDSLPPEQERRVLGMMVGRFVVEFFSAHWKAVLIAAGSVFGIQNLPEILRIFSGSDG